MRWRKHKKVLCYLLLKLVSRIFTLDQNYHVIYYWVMLRNQYSLWNSGNKLDTWFAEIASQDFEFFCFQVPIKILIFRRCWVLTYYKLNSSHMLKKKTKKQQTQWKPYPYLWWLEWIVRWKCDIQEKNTPFIYRTRRSKYSWSPFINVISFRAGTA